MEQNKKLEKTIIVEEKKPVLGAAMLAGMTQKMNV